MSEPPLSPQDRPSLRGAENPTEPTPTAPAPKTSIWRKLVWIAASILIGFAAVLLAIQLVDPPMDDLLGWTRFRQNKGVGAAAIIVSAILGWWGLRRDWPRRGSLWKGNLAAFATLILALGVVPFFRLSRHNKDQSVRGQMRQASANVGWFFNENPYRIFVTYDDLIGPGKFLRSLASIQGEDYRALFPIRRGSDWEEWSLILPGGRKIDFGNQTNPFPDGVRKQRWPDGRRFETTYRHGRPDGPFRAYLPDGTLWGEATYEQGRLVGPAWLVTRDGRKFNELTDGAAGHAAFLKSAASGADTRASSGRKKLAAGNFRGAIADLTQAIKADPADQALYRARADARMALRDQDGAIVDYLKAEGMTDAVGFDFPEYLRDLILQRGRRRLAAGDPKGADADFRAIASAAVLRGEKAIRQRDFAGAIKALDAIIAVAPLAELHALRGDARRSLRNFTGAENDYTRALALDADGAMLHPESLRLSLGLWHYKRGHVRRWSGNLAGAAEDFHTAIPLAGKSLVLSRENPAAWLFFVQCEQGDRATALAELSRNLPSHSTDGQHRHPVCLLLGEITVAQLDTAAADTSTYHHQPKASLYVGLLHQLAGDHAAAQTRFRAVLGYRNADELLHEVAQHALERSLSTGIRPP